MKAIKADLQFPEIEQDVLEFWDQDNIFAKQNQARKDAPEFSFYDGPPFANGLPHYGHLLANTIKDTVTRYWIMRGYQVDRRFGWDCHGLPVEYEIEKREKLNGRPDILKMGVERFNETCRESVLHYSGEWRKTITRLGRWVDWDRQYRTMDPDFMESVWAVFAKLHEKGLIYRDFKVVPYSPRTTSVVSNFEANQNYKQVQDPAVTIKFQLKEEENTYLLAWTTTPWTLFSNLALAVGVDVEYAKIRDAETSQLWILAKSRLSALYEGKGGEDGYEILETMQGSELLGLRYHPIFPHFKDHPQSFSVLEGHHVTIDNGTGIVHMAPAFGEDDYLICKEAGIELVDPIDATGCFTKKIPEFEGQYVKDADKGICKLLKERGFLIRHDTLVHSYPFCERTDTPLIYKAVPSWYVRVESLVEKLVKNNQEVHWVPGHLKNGRMGKWLENARDWAISRNRFWGTPIPVWSCAEGHQVIVGSRNDLETRCEKEVSDLHAHRLQDHTFACEHCGSAMSLGEEVFDCWFESGSMPYAQLHYPMENQERFEANFPADFIAEGLDQTRGWFYTLAVLSTALFDKPAFKNVVVNGVILDATGKKMSKRHRNYTAPDELLNSSGADSTRLYMLNSHLLRGEDLIFTDHGVRDTVRAVMLPLWNACSFLTTYAAADEWSPARDLVAPTKELDLWMVSRLQTLAHDVEKHMEDYQIYLVVGAVVKFIDDLTNWYIRLSRRRFWGESSGGLTQDQKEAFSTLYRVLVDFCKIFAPFAPFLTDFIYRHLTEELSNAKESVHLCDMPRPNTGEQFSQIENHMDLVRTAVNHGRSLRQKHKIGIRQVLQNVVVVTHPSMQIDLKCATEVICQELNVKNVEYSTEESQYVSYVLKPQLRRLGPRLGKDLGKVRGFLQKMEVKTISECVKQLEHGSIDICGHQLDRDDILIECVPLGEQAVTTGGGVTVVLETQLTPELIAEGFAREFVNRTQKLRKDSQLDVSDRIRIECQLPDKLYEMIEPWQHYICDETLALEWSRVESSSFAHSGDYDIQGMQCVIYLQVDVI
ncbi:MAG: isoleucine--tRNA ligase [Oligoflexales bacterium]